MRQVLLLRALGGAGADAPPPPPPLADPLVTAVRRRLILADLCRSSDSLDLTRSGDRVGLRLLLPATTPSARADDAERAQGARRILAETLMAEGFRSIFTDALWSDRGARGWSVVARAQSAQPVPPA